jgi:hypothetical protein
LPRCKVCFLVSYFSPALVCIADTSFFQGKYSLQVLPAAGHFVQEDQPAKTASYLIDLFKRNDRGAMVLPPKVGDMMAMRAMESR